MPRAWTCLAERRDGAFCVRGYRLMLLPALLVFKRQGGGVALGARDDAGGIAESSSAVEILTAGLPSERISLKSTVSGYNSVIARESSAARAGPAGTVSMDDRIFP
jgi:hypothetical protein